MTPRRPENRILFLVPVSSGHTSMLLTDKSVDIVDGQNECVNRRSVVGHANSLSLRFEVFVMEVDNSCDTSR